MTLDRTLSYRQHIQNTMIKVATRNTLLKKLANSKWETNANTIRITALALCYSIAEYAAPVWVRSTYGDILEPELNKACRAMTGCLNSTYVEDLYLLAGIAPPDIRKYVCARMERTKQMEQETHSHYALDTLAVKSRGRNGVTSMETLHVRAVWMLKTRRICYNVLS